MAETDETVVVIPVILEVAEVKLPVTVRVPIHVRHPVVTVAVNGMYGVPSFFTENNSGHSLYFILSLPAVRQTLTLISMPHRLI